VNSFNRLYWECGEGDIIATHHPTQGKQAAIVSYRTRYKNQGSRGLLRTPKDHIRSRGGAFPSGSEPLSSLSSRRRDRQDMTR